MINRIKEILLREGLTSGSFADEIGVQRSSLSHIINGRNNPSLDFIMKVMQRFPRINSDWLLMGTGDMYIDEGTEDKVDEALGGTQDLFSAMNSKPPVIEESVNIGQIPEVPVNQVIQPEKAEKYVSQIFILYSDSTYQVYKPENPGK